MVATVRMIIFSIISYLMLHVACENSTYSTKLTCRVDYHGSIKFTISVPKAYRDREGIQAYFYYLRDNTRGARSNDMHTWEEEKDCMLTEEGDMYHCTMRELAKQREYFMTYQFKFTIISKNSTVNIREIYFGDKENYKVYPWTTTTKVIQCRDSVGVKYLALYSTLTNITLEWIRYPLDIAYGIAATHRISIMGPGINISNIKVSHRDSCKKDLCTYTHQSLKPCSAFQICILTSLPELKHKLCKSIRTYCSPDSLPVLQWQGTLLIIFGAIILITFISMGFALFSQHKIALAHSDEVADDEVTPRDHATQDSLINESDPVYYDINTNTYHYPNFVNTKVLEVF